MGIITVTAEKTEENLQEIPLSVTSLSDVQIEDAGIRKTEDFIQHVPNIHILKQADRSGISNINSRGVSGTSYAGNSGIAFYVDGAYYSAGVETELLDVERIEILRGPQGTLYGRNTQSGVINIISKKPSNQWEGKILAGYGNYATQNYNVMVNAPLVSDKLSLRMTAGYVDSDGYLENSHTGNDRLDARDYRNGRVSFDWKATESLNVSLSSDILRYETGYGGYKPMDELRSDPHTVNYNVEGSVDQEGNGQILKIDYDQPSFTLTSVTTRRYWNSDDWTDLDFTPADNMLANYYHETTGYSQELRLASNNEESPLQWLAGLYFFDEEFIADYLTEYHQGYASWGLPPFDNAKYNKTDSTGYAVFGQATYTLSEKFDLTAGLRYDYEKKDFTYRERFAPDLSAQGMSPVSLESDTDYSEILPKLAADYRWSTDCMIYASIAKGYKSGGFNAYSTSVAGVPFDPEHSWNYEVGLKSSWFDDRISINLAAFYIDWKDNQVLQQTGPGEVSITNAADSTSKGFELELHARPVKGLTFSAGFGYTDAQFDDYIDKIYNPATGTAQGEMDYSGNDIAYTPEYTYNLGVTYRSMNGFFAHADCNGTGAFYHDVANKIKESGYVLVNARVGYEMERFEIYLWAKNLFDEAYATRAFDNGSSVLARAGDPQTFGITLSARF